MKPPTDKQLQGWAKQRKRNAEWRKANPDWPVCPSPEQLKALKRAFGVK